MQGWKYYNHAAVPIAAPHEEVDTTPVINGDIWKMTERPLLARWTSDFDTATETNWWYVVKDSPFDISALNAKRRYEINKGKKNFSVREFDPQNHKEEIFDIQIAAYSAYPAKYRPTIDKKTLFEDIDDWGPLVAIGAFSRESDRMCGYALLYENGTRCMEFAVLKADPAFEKQAVNAALVEGVLKNHEDFLTNGGYICDGSRNINHETAFQDYLEKYFMFRKAFCKLHLAYAPKVRILLRLLYPFSKLLLRFDGMGIIHKLNSILKMEEIVRRDNE